MADYAISNVPRRVVYAASGVGPYAFTFEILDQTDIAVYKASTLLTLTTDYTVTINADGTGEVTLVATAGTSNITIVGSKNIQRTTDFTTGGDLFADALNDELDNQTIFIQQVAETAERGLKAPVTDPTDIAMTLPAKASRAGKILAFDANGNPVVGEDIGNWRDDWASGTSYTVRDLVKDASNYNVYRCNTAHTSSGTTPISSNADSAKWDLVVDAEYAKEQADAAAASASAAQTSETNAGISEANAETSETNAANSASDASTSATNAFNSETAAASSATSAASLYDQFDDRYLGSKSSNPTVDNDGNTLLDGALYWNTTDNEFRVYDLGATTWKKTVPSSAEQANINTVAGISEDVTIVADNVTDIYNYADTYQGAKSSAPSVRNDSSALQAGDLYFNTTDDQMKVYDGVAWGSVGSTVNGTSERFRYIATSGQTTFTGTDSNGFTLAYDAGFIDVYLNGVRLDQADYTASSGDSVVLASGATTNDELNIVTYGNFEIADVYTKTASDDRFRNLSVDIPVADINATGTPSDSTFLRGDGAWVVVDVGVTSLNGQTGAITNTDYGAIGSYVIAAENTFTAGLERLPNVTVAGSSLIRSTYASSFNAGLSASNSAGSFVSNTENTSLGLSGTWRRMTRSSTENDASTQSPINLYVRVS